MIKTKLRNLVTEYSLRNRNGSCTDVYSVTNSQGFIPSTDYFSKEVFSKDLTTYKIVKKGMIAYNPSRINVGSVAVQRVAEEVIVSPLYVVFSVNEDELIPEYLTYFLHSDKGLHQISSNTSGSVRDSLKFTALQNIEINTYSLEEQKEIIVKFQKFERLIEKQKALLKKLDDLVKSQFIEMFGGGKFEELPISEFVDIQIESAKKKYNAEDSIRYIDISSIDNKLNLMTGFSEYYFKDAPSRAQQCLKCGDIVISTVRPNLRNIAMNNYQYSNLVASSGFCILRAKKCNSKFLFCAVLLDDFSRKMTEVTTGANYPAIKDSDVLSYRIPNAPIDAQNKFAQFVQQTDKSKVLNLIHFFSINPYRRVVKSGKICYNKAHKEVV